MNIKMKVFHWLIVLTAGIIGASTAGATGVLGTPVAGTIVSGVGAISGYHCTSKNIDVYIDGVSVGKAGGGTTLLGTQQVCGRTDTGYSLLYNFNNLTPGDHTVSAYADGTLFATATFRTTQSGGQPWLSGLDKSISIQDFPSVGRVATLQWVQSYQNFVITNVTNVVQAPLPSVPTDVYEAMLENELFQGYRSVGVDVTDGTQDISSVGCGYTDPLPSPRSSFESLLSDLGASITTSTTTTICASMGNESFCSRLIGGSYALQSDEPGYSEIDLYLPQLIAGHMTSIEYFSGDGLAKMSSVQSDLSYSSDGTCAQQSITQPASAIDGVWRGYKARYFPSLGTGLTNTAALNCSNQLCTVTDSQGDTASIQFSQQSSNGVWKGPTGATTNARAVMSLDKQLLSLYVCPAPLVESSAIENCSFFTFIH